MCWVSTLSWISLGLAGISFLIILLHILLVKRQHMMIMNIVWPVTALYAGPLALLAYFTLGRTSAGAMHKKEISMRMTSSQRPFWQHVVVGALHCGSGCTIGDILSEILFMFLPITLLGSRLFGKWTLDYVFAFGIGIIFQYYAIKPMKKLSTDQALQAALKADTLSLTSWQVGMYGWMAISIFGLFHHPLEPDNPVFWFMMQIAMMLGFCTSYPVNWWLIRKGIKEAM